MRSRVGRLLSAAAIGGMSLGGMVVLSGCEADSFIDPSVVGRWELTPTVVPVLDRLAAVEGPTNQGVETSKIRPEDLVPEVEAYRLGPGDRLEIEIQDLFGDSRPERLDRDVDPRGFLELPQISPLFVDNATVEQVQDRIIAGLKEKQILGNALVTVVVRERRRLTYNVFGGVSTPGLFPIPRPDFRLLEALSQVGRFTESIQSVYVIRQIPLNDAVMGRARPAAKPEDGSTPAANPSAPPKVDQPKGSDPNKPKDNIVDLIDELTKPKPPSPGGTGGGGTPKPSPSVLRARQPAPPEAPKTTKPTVDLVDESRQPNTPKTEAPAPTGWQFVNGQWVQTGSKTAPGGTPAQTPGGASAGSAELMTQRVIEIPLAPLLAGSAAHNIVIRPGDIIRVPSSPEGLVYVAGQVLRPGPYNLPAVGKLTLLRAVQSAAGGLGQLAIPERVDVIRFVSPDRQATVRVNMRAIAEQTQPDIFLKADDMINVGTNFWAFPLAILRQGLRMSYGYGFILDRNFAGTVFGPEPVAVPQ